MPTPPHSGSEPTLGALSLPLPPSPRKAASGQAASPASETGDRTCDWETVHRLAASTAGAVVTPDALQAVLDVLTSDRTRSYREEVTRIPMWDRWPLFFFILIFLCVEWAGRKRAGLI